MHIIQLTLFEGKVCLKCGTWKNRTQYWEDRRAIDGLRNWCIDCFQAIEPPQRMPRTNTRRPFVSSTKRFRRGGLSEREKQDRRAAQARTNYHVRPKKPKRNRRALTAEERAAKHNERVRHWRRTTDQARLRAYCAAQRQQRRAQRKGNGGSFTADEWQRLCVLYDNRCLRCKEQKPLTVDHIIPLAKGGKNDITNLQPLCFSCNSSKGAKIVDYR
jgi:5-methylcytosine-specific restriction endonuclease McrA